MLAYFLIYFISNIISCNYSSTFIDYYSLAIIHSYLFTDTRETGFVNAITSAGVTYAVTKACTLGNLVECSCDKSHSRRNGGQPQMVNAVTAVAALEKQQAAYEKNSTRARHNGNNSRRGNGNRRRKLLKNIKFPEGEWEWGGCSDNVNFGFRHSRIFLDSKYRRRSDLRTLVKLHNNMAGRLVSNLTKKKKNHGNI